MLKQTRNSFEKTAKVQMFLMSMWLRCIEDVDVPAVELSKRYWNDSQV